MSCTPTCARRYPGPTSNRSSGHPEEIDTLGPEAVVVIVDGWTSVGGSQWIDSDGIGRYGTYLHEEVVPFVDAGYPTNGARGLQGKSSGGYGAIVNTLARPDLFHAFAAHAPDALFEVTLAHGFPAAARALTQRGIASMTGFWESFSGLDEPGNALLAELGACALAFGDGELPFDPETATVDTERWEQWLAHDSVRLVGEHQAAVAGLRGAWLDAGDHDEYNLERGALALRRAIQRTGLPEERLHFELFPGGHRGISHRYPLSLAYLVGSLSITF